MVSSAGVRSDVWLRAAWEAASDAMALSDPEGVVLAANPAYYRLYGYGPDEVIGKSFTVIFPEARRAAAEARYREVFRSSVHPPAYEVVIRRRDGTERTVASRVSFVEEAGERVAMLNVIRDVTDEAAARRAAGAVERERRTFLSSVAHDIKNPLAAIKGHAQLLRRAATRAIEPPAPGAFVAGLTQIEASAGRLARLVDELVEVAAHASGDVPPLRVERADLVALVKDAAVRHERMTDEHEFTVEAAVDALPGRWDVARIERVLDNLLSNAAKYSPGGGTITLGVAPAARRRPGCDETACAGALLTVRDEGIGIPAADLAHVFERYCRGGNVNPTVLGSGVGLTSVKHIVEQHGGVVDIDSREGEGTTVSVWLPLEAPCGGGDQQDVSEGTPGETPDATSDATPDAMADGGRG